MIARVINSDWALPVYLLLCLILGGASAAGVVANGIIQLSAVLIIVAVIFAGKTRQFVPSTVNKLLLLWAASIVIWLIVQLVPLPPSLWTALPGRDILVEGIRMLDADVNAWRTIALEPEYTIASLLSLLPVAAIILLANRCSVNSLNIAMHVIILFAFVSLIVGILQILQGAQSPLYFYSITNHGTSTGFFANSNHLATLLLVAMILAVSGVGGVSTAGRKGRRHQGRFYVWAAISLFFFVNLLVNRSLAGVFISLLCLCYFGLIILGYYRGKNVSVRAILISFTTALLALPIAMYFLADTIQTKILRSTDPAFRLEFFRNTFEAAKDFFPFGAGLGNFRWIYTYYERETISVTNFVNHAHNDWLEFLLQSGAFGLVIVGCGCVLVAYNIKLGFSSDNGASGNHKHGGHLVDNPAAWAPYLVLAVILLHSIVDYPLRTTAIAALAAISLSMICRGYHFTARWP